MNSVLYTRLVKTITIVSILFFVTGISRAQTNTSTTGKFTNLLKGDVVPYDGTLFDPVAIAKILADKKFSKKSCDIRIEYEKAITQVKCDKDTALLGSELAIENKKYNSIVDAQQEEIESLRKLAKGGGNTFWATIGFALGSITSVAIFFAAVEISK